MDKVKLFRILPRLFHITYLEINVGWTPVNVSGSHACMARVLTILDEWG